MDKNDLIAKIEDLERRVEDLEDINERELKLKKSIK